MRNLEKVLALCENAKKDHPEDIQVVKCPCGDPVCKQVVLTISRVDGRLDAEVGAFFAEAWKGWPHAIKRALDAEEKLDKLIHEIRMLQDSMQERCHK